VQGGPVHDYYTAEWQKKSLGTPEYLFDLFAARAAIYGVESVDEMLAYGPRLSLKTQGFLGRPSAPMLVVNGEKDSQVPISDLYMLIQSGGSAKWSMGQSRRGTHGALAGMAEFQDRRRSHHALDQGSARTRARKQTGSECRVVTSGLRSSQGFEKWNFLPAVDVRVGKERRCGAK